MEAIPKVQVSFALITSLLMSNPLHQSLPLLALPVHNIGNLTETVLKLFDFKSNIFKTINNDNNASIPKPFITPKRELLFSLRRRYGDVLLSIRALI